MENNYDIIIKNLSDKGVIFTPGLTESEITICEKLYNFKFPLPLKDFYSLALPISHNFYNWRDISPDYCSFVKNQINWPLEGILFDIENNMFWYDKWGVKPDKTEDAKKLCADYLGSLPTLVPIFGHRYMPYVENEINLPVYSIWQTDIIYYGENLTSYFEIEFGYKNHEEIKHDNIPNIEFWGDLVS